MRVERSVAPRRASDRLALSVLLMLGVTGCAVSSASGTTTTTAKQAQRQGVQVADPALPGLGITSCANASTCFTLNDDPLFASGQASLSGNSPAVLTYILSQVGKPASTYLTICGYTDGVGSADYNVQLSAQRAHTVQQYLLNHSQSNGQPIAPGHTKAIPEGERGAVPGKADQNRRIVVVITGKSFEECP